MRPPPPPLIGYENYLPKPCEQLEVIATSVVRYKANAVCYIRLGGNPVLNGTQLSVFNGNDIYKKIVFDGKPEILIEGLPLNRDFSIQYDACGQKVLLTTFTTTAIDDHPQGLLISSPLFDAIADYRKTENVSLPDYLKKESTLNYYEKLSFWQDVAFHDVVFEPNLPYNEYPPAPDQYKAGGECICLLLLTEPRFSPGNNNNTSTTDIPVPEGSIPIYNGYISPISTTYTQDWVAGDPGHGGYSHSLRGKGAARQQLNSADGRQIPSRKSELNVSGEGISPYYGQIKLMWYCFTDLWHFDDCGCKKDVSYTAKYNTRLKTKMELPSCFLCGTKKGLSTAEDWSVLTLHSQAGDFQTLAAGRGVVGTKCNVSWNPDFFISIVDIAEGIATALIGGGSTTDWASQVGTIADGIQNIIQTPIQTASTCAATSEDVALIHKDGMFTIDPNMPYYLSLFSGGNTVVSGATSWTGYARIVSDFRLALAVPYGYYNDQPETCCTYGLSSWVMGNYQTLPYVTPTGVIATVLDPFPSPTNIEAMKADILSFFQLYLLGFNNTEYGALWKKACTAGGKWDDNLSYPGDIIGEYALYDMAGQLVDSGRGRMEDIGEQIQSTPKFFQKGMYILQFKANGNILSKKIIKY